MYHNDGTWLQLANERERDLVRKLEHDRLMREAELGNPSHRHRFYHVVDWVGRLLVRWGEHMQAWHAMRHHQALTHTMEG